MVIHGFRGPQAGNGSTPSRDFGVNEWLAAEIHDRYLRDPGSVDPAWRALFEGSQQVVPLRGSAGRLAANMEASLEVPAATSARIIPVAVLIENRSIINDCLKRAGSGRVSLTHLIGYAIVQAVKADPRLNARYAQTAGRPSVVTPEHVNLGLAVDVTKTDGSRALTVPTVRAAEQLDFHQFWRSCMRLVSRARRGLLTVDDISGPTISVTNTGSRGTSLSVPRLMRGQGAIVGLGAAGHPAAYSGSAASALPQLAVSQVMTITATYDHRIIQGATCGEFLAELHRLLLGTSGFYDGIFDSLQVPHEPVRWEEVSPRRVEHELSKGARVMAVIESYRARGYLMADLDPLALQRRRCRDLSPAAHGLTLWDLEREFATGGLGGRPAMRLRDILALLRDRYCGTVGIEFMHIQDPAQRRWIQTRAECHRGRPDRAGRLRILSSLTAAEGFEAFLHAKYVGQKRFSLEGGEAAIVILDQVISAAAAAGVREALIAMSHRGRLNVATNIAGRPHQNVFNEFAGKSDPGPCHGSGDVKYNQGYVGTLTASAGQRVKVTLLPNASHLEAVGPVLQGVARARQDIAGPPEPARAVLPILTHGDAAFAGQGVVAETLNMSQLDGFRTGGTVHLVINNQMGFTTPPDSARSSRDPTGVARMIEAPIIHVNANDPEACAWGARLAVNFRQAFSADVVIDMVCYRRRGHYESDDPSVTQPLLYRAIGAIRPVRERYAGMLVRSGDVTAAEIEQLRREHQDGLEQLYSGGVSPPVPIADPGSPSPDAEPDVPAVPRTSISADLIKHIAGVHARTPAEIELHSRVVQQYQRRVQMITEGTVDWAMAETLAFGSLLVQGVPVRLTGEDSRRGTFGQRHHVVVDQASGREHIPLSGLAECQAPYQVHDSMLSEYATAAFEYGYSVARPDALVLWEAQYGDFSNGAQIIVDEYLSSGEQKWGQRSGLTLLLPHGHEGQGPNHSSARIERFLQLCAQDNMTVAMPSLPSSYFHLLRWQALSRARRPLVIFTPKSMLRLRAAVSRIEEFTAGELHSVIGDTAVPAAGVRCILVCSGKIYWDLAAHRAQRGRLDTAIIRAERLYPLPTAELQRAVASYPPDAELRWVQEEPFNQGAWPFISLHLSGGLAGRTIRCVSRPAAAAPATGSARRHITEHNRLITDSFA
jgi:2-oxoglutarate dehydrogenase E1 component